MMERFVEHLRTRLAEGTILRIETSNEVLVMTEGGELEIVSYTNEVWNLSFRHGVDEQGGVI